MKESFLCKDGVEIIGIGPREKVIITSNTSACLQVKARILEIKRVKVRNITLRGASKRKATVSLSNGQLLIEDCDITSASSECVSISNPRANHTLRNCTIHNGADGGILLTNHAKGTIEDCEVYDNTEAGVIIREYATPIIRRCTIHSGQKSGIFIEKNEGSNLGAQDRVQILECTIFENAEHGIEIQHVEASAKSEPLVQTCLIYDNKRCGISVTNKGRGTLEKCEIFRNASEALAEVEISGKDSQLTLRQCEMYDSHHCGIVIHDEGEGRIVGCAIYCNTLAGVEVTAQGKVTLKEESHIKYGQKNGVFIHDHGQGDIENCFIYENEAAGVKLQPGTVSIRITNCKIYDSRGSGILIYGKSNEAVIGEVTIEGCDIFKNANGGIELRGNVHPTISYCNVYEGNGVGILACEQSKGNIRHTNIHHNAYIGAAIKHSELTFEACRIYDNLSQGIMISEQGRVDIDKACTFIRNKGGTLQTQVDCQIMLKGKKMRLTDYIVLFVRSLGMMKNG